MKGEGSRPTPRLCIQFSAANLLRQSVALQQLLEAGVGFKTVEARIGV